MIEKSKRFVKGNQIHKLTTFRSFKGLMIQIMRGYPAYAFYGMFESQFPEIADKVIEILDEDEVIKLLPTKEGEEKQYRITPKGINLAVSLINLEYGEKVLKYSEEVKKYNKQMKGLTLAIVGLTILSLVLALN